MTDQLLQCLVSLTHHYQKPFAAETLVTGLPLENNQLTPELFERAAERANLNCKLINLNLDDLNSDSLPIVLLQKGQQACLVSAINDDHTFTVLVRTTKHGQPEQIRLDYEEVAREFIGQAILAKPNYKFDSRTEEKQQKPSRGWVWTELFSVWPIYSEVLVASLLINCFALASPLFVMNVYDRVVPNQVMETLWALAVGVSIVFGFDLMMKILRGYFLDVASKQVDVKLSMKIYARLLGLDTAAKPQSVGVLVNKVQSFESFREFMTSATVSVLIDLPFVTIFIATIAWIGGPIAFVPLLLIPLVIGVGWLLQLPLNKMAEQSYRHASEKQALLIESLSAMETIKAQQAEGVMQGRWERIICRSAKLNVKLRFFSNLGVNFSMFAQQFASVLVVIVGVYLIADAKLTMGALIACTILTGRALAPMSQVASLLSRYHQMKTALTGLDQVMQLPVERRPGESPIQRPDLKGEIEFRQVNFAYPNQTTPALQDISFHIKPGEKVGVVGLIGSGKTTLEKLMLAFYQPSSGTILLDGVELHQLDLANLRGNIGYVPQDVELFFGSIKENILIGTANITDEALLKAAYISGLDDFVKLLPDGFDTQVGERGHNLSGGQRQLIAITRALLTDPPILILDEPTSSMDDRTQANFIQRIEEAGKDKTIIMVTHQGRVLSLVDSLLVMDRGKIIARGPRDEVIGALRNKGKNNNEKVSG